MVQLMRVLTQLALIEKKENLILITNTMWTNKVYDIETSLEVVVIGMFVLVCAKLVMFIVRH